MVPFTESQWKELENQTLAFKYLAANVPVPPHLLFLIKRPFLFPPPSSSSPSSFFSPTLSPHFGWNVYEMRMGRKIDTEPGRCRRTDGKKWRCSKEAYPDSKYCERHMHRGKNRSSSRKPLPLTPPRLTQNLFQDSSLSSSRFRKHSLLLFYSNGNTKIDSFPLKTCLRVSRRRRSGYMDDLFSIEPSGSTKSCSGSAMEDDEGSSCRGISSFSNVEKQQDRRCFILGTELGTLERPLMFEGKLKQRDEQDYEEEEEEEEEQRSKRLYRFLDEWPSSKSSVSTSLFI